MWTLTNPHPFLITNILGCRECKSKEIIIEQKTKMFESRTPAGATEQLLGWEKPHAQTVAWSLENALSDTANWQTKK